MTRAPHVCWHRLVAQRGQHLYYQCRCGSRRYGASATAKQHATLDAAWLVGEKDHLDDR